MKNPQRWFGWLNSLAAGAMALSQASSPIPQEYGVICIGEDATGFDWQNRNWVRNEFRPATLVFQKISLESCPNTVSRPPMQTLFDAGEQRACFSIRRIDNEAMPPALQNCWESRRESEAASVWQIRCIGTHNIRINVDGGFIRHTMSSVDDRRMDYRDSLILEVGSCHRIN